MTPSNPHIEAVSTQPLQSSSQFWSPNSEFQHPAPAHSGGSVFQAGECRAATYCSVLPLVLLPQITCCILVLMLWSSPSILSDLPTSEGPFRIQETFILSQLLPEGHRFCPDFFLFCLPSYMEIFFLSAVWDLLPVFSRYPMRTVLHIDVFFHVSGEKVSFISY